MGVLRSLISAVLLLSFAAHAQDDRREDLTGKNTLYEIGAHFGDLLPNQVPGVTEIMGLGGVRGGFRLMPFTYAEGGIMAGNGSGAEWRNIHADVRMDIPVENLVGSAYIGADSTYFRGTEGNTHVIFGGHAGGAIQALLTGALWFRSDMKFNFSPGTSLYVGFGFTFRFGAANGGT